MIHISIHSHQVCVLCVCVLSVFVCAYLPGFIIDLQGQLSSRGQDQGHGVLFAAAIFSVVLRESRGVSNRRGVLTSGNSGRTGSRSTLQVEKCPL